MNSLFLLVNVCGNKKYFLVSFIPTGSGITWQLRPQLQTLLLLEAALASPFTISGRNRNRKWGGRGRHSGQLKVVSWCGRDAQVVTRRHLVTFYGILFLNGPTPASFSFLFLVFSNEQFNFSANQCEKMSKCPSSKWRQDSNPRPFEHDLSPITTRPGLTFFGNFISS